MTSESLVDNVRVRGPLKWDVRFLQLAQLVSTWSKDPSTKAGAVIVGLDKRIISVGFNGFPKGMPDTPELYENREEKYSRVVHCEINALIFAGHLPPHCTLYTYPFPPCERCVVQMLQAGIGRFVAPIPTAEMNSRWLPAFEKTRLYIKECGANYEEVNPDNLIDEDLRETAKDIYAEGLATGLKLNGAKGAVVHVNVCERCQKLSPKPPCPRGHVDCQGDGRYCDHNDV